MLASLPTTWTVFRRTPDGFERLGAVAAEFEGQAMDAACRIPGGPRSPIVAHAYVGGREPIDFSQHPAPVRRSRRHAGV